MCRKQPAFKYETQFTEPLLHLMVTTVAVCGWESPAGLGMQVFVYEESWNKKQKGRMWTGFSHSTSFPLVSLFFPCVLCLVEVMNDESCKSG